MKIFSIKQNFGLAILFIFLMYSVARALNFFLDLFPADYLKYYFLFFVFSGLISFLLGNFNIFKQIFEFNRYFALELLLISSLFFSIILQNIFLDNRLDEFGRASLVTTFGYLIFGLTYFYIGSAVQNWNKYITKRVVYVFPALLLLVLILINIDEGVVLAYNSLSSGRSDDVSLDHLAVGEVAVVLLFFSTTFSPEKFKYFLYIFSIICLFALGGRIALISFIIAIFLRELMQSSVINYFKILIGLLLTSLLIFYFFEVDLNDPLVKRMIFSDGLGQDESKLARDSFLESGLGFLWDQFLFGNPNILIDNYNNLGTYVHNIFSAWQFFGFIPFILFVIIIFIIYMYIYINRRILTGSMDDFGVLLFFYTSISILIGKAIMFFLFWMAIGFWIYRMRR